MDGESRQENANNIWSAKLDYLDRNYKFNFETIIHTRQFKYEDIMCNVQNIDNISNSCKFESLYNIHENSLSRGFILIANNPIIIRNISGITLYKCETNDDIVINDVKGSMLRYTCKIDDNTLIWDWKNYIKLLDKTRFAKVKITFKCISHLVEDMSIFTGFISPVFASWEHFRRDHPWPYVCKFNQELVDN